MRRYQVIGFCALLALLWSAPRLKAQITGQVVATIHHKFTIVNTTLPPGKYTFRMLGGTELTEMQVSSADGNTLELFLVNEAEAPKVPSRSELIFNRYGKDEYLEKVFEAGSRMGVSVAEPSRAELREQRKGHHPVTHSEEQ